MWEGERPVPLRLMLPLEARDDAERIGAITVAAESGARVPLRDLADIQVTNGVASINREGNSRYLALKFNVEGRDMGSVVQGRHRDRRARSVQAARGPLLRLGRRVREPAARDRAAQAGRARWRC